MMAGMLLAGVAHAQQVTSPAPAEPVSPPDTNGEPLVPTQGNVTTLGEVRAIKPEDDQPLDLYRFKSPVQAAPNRFSREWKEPPSLEQAGMSGGYVAMGIAYGIAKTAQGLHKLTRAPDQIQSAIARPPPELTPEQQQRAAALCEQEGCAQTSDGH